MSSERVRETARRIRSSPCLYEDVFGFSKKPARAARRPRGCGGFGGRARAARPKASRAGAAAESGAPCLYKTELAPSTELAPGHV